MHFATNRFTFEKFLPPPPLLHPTFYQLITETKMIFNLRVVFSRLIL